MTVGDLCASARLSRFSGDMYLGGFGVPGLRCQDLTWILAAVFSHWYAGDPDGCVAGHGLA